jgi:translation elongation factor EF-G
VSSTSLVERDSFTRRAIMKNINFKISEISNLKRGEGFIFEDKVVGGSPIPKTYIPSADRGIRKVMADGIIVHCPMVDLKESLYEGP